MTDATPRGLAGRRASRLPAILWIAFTLFIAYGTTIPFHFTSDLAFASEKLSRVSLNPLLSPDTGRRVSIPDVVQNVLLFVPFGIFGAVTLRRRLSVAASVAAVATLALILSTSVETIQLFIVDRTSSFSDICANTTGAIFGAVAGVIGSRFSRSALSGLRRLGLVDVATFYPFMIATIVVCVAAWEPFDFTLDVGSLVGRLRALHANPWQFDVVSDEGIEIVRYAIFGLLGSLWLRELGVRSAAAVATIGGTAVAVGLEASQWIIGSRMPGLEDALVHSAGVAAGVLLSGGWPFGRSTQFWCVVLWVATAAGAALQMLSPFTLVPHHQAFAWMPFANYYEHTSFETVSHTFEQALIYFPPGFAISQARRRGAYSWGLAIIATLLVAGPIEYLQGWVAGRYGDVTDAGVAVLGALAGVWTGGAGWRRFRQAGVKDRSQKSSVQ
jgi:VanZ family protein